MKIEYQGGTYLGFLVGTQVDAKMNFAAAMNKFRVGAAYWLSQRQLGWFFQVRGLEFLAHHQQFDEK